MHSVRFIALLIMLVVMVSIFIAMFYTAIRHHISTPAALQKKRRENMLVEVMLTAVMCSITLLLASSAIQVLS